MSAPPRGTTPACVLVVDDDELTRMWARAALGGAGFSTVEAANGEAALEWVSHTRPDLILLDVDMPGMDGFEVCSRLRDMPALEGVPVVMTTGLDDSGSIDRAYAVGATDFAVKPVNWSLLRHRLRYLLRASEMVDELARSRATLTEAQRIARLGSWEWDARTGDLSWSDQMLRLLGMQPGVVVPSFECFLERVHPDDRKRVRGWIGDAKSSRGATCLTHRVVLADGSQRSVYQQCEMVYDDAGAPDHVRGILQDITERQRAEEKIHQLAYFDSLTRLPNRELFKEYLRWEVKRARRQGQVVATLFLDLDNFKRVNDTLGHDVGDLLLKAVAGRLNGTMRSTDAVKRAGSASGEAIVARLGGDEFAVLLTDVKDGESAGAVAERIVQTLAQPVTFAGYEVRVTPSVGIAVYPQDGDRPEILLKNADTAMYSAKRAGKNHYRFYDESMNEAALERLRMEARLCKAIERGELQVHYQPQMDLRSGRIESVEALLRWDSPELGPVEPLAFIALAEESDLILSIGEWVLRTACAQARAWRDEGVGLERVAVNISPVQFQQPDFAALVRRVLDETRLDAGALELEMTESLLARDVDAAIATLKDLKTTGVHLSIDDFGTGYSSLSQLKRFPIDRLKIDRSFVSDIIIDPDDAAIATAVIGMARSMNLYVIAEGVETEAQMQFLRSRNCDEIQGFLVSPALPAQELVATLREGGVVPSLGEAAVEHTVLLVDDDPVLLEMIAIELEWENYRLLCAADATQALELLAENAVNVVVSDVMMPGMKGTDFLSRVHRLYPETLRIMLSGHGDMDTVVTAVNSGAIYRYLDKPVNGGVLRRTLREGLTLCDMRERRSEPSPEASAPGRAYSAVDQIVATA